MNPFIAATIDDQGDLFVGAVVEINEGQGPEGNDLWLVRNEFGVEKSVNATTCCAIDEERMAALGVKPELAGQFVQFAQGEGFDSLYAFDDSEARDLFAALQGYEITGEEVILDMNFVVSTLLEEPENYSIGIYMIERGVSFEDMNHKFALELLRWYANDFDDTPGQSDETWQTVQGPALDEKAKELIECGFYA